jgi:hypothetical protein
MFFFFIFVYVWYIATSGTEVAKFTPWAAVGAAVGFTETNNTAPLVLISPTQWQHYAHT